MTAGHLFLVIAGTTVGGSLAYFWRRDRLAHRRLRDGSCVRCGTTLPSDPLVANEATAAGLPLVMCDDCAERVDRRQRLGARVLTGFVTLGLLAFVWGITRDHLRGHRYSLKEWGFILGAMSAVTGLLAYVRAAHVRMRRVSELDAGEEA